jgi:hypothetical protein
MRFVMYFERYTRRRLQVNWDAPVELTPEVRAAMAPQYEESLLAGVLRRPFVYEPSPPGTRTKQPRRAKIKHDKGALVFAQRESGETWIEVTD